MKNSGFTVVEMLVVIVIIVILLTLSVVNIRSTQIQSRDNERNTDVSTLRVQLETAFTSSSNPALAGSYPSTVEMNTESNLRQRLKDTAPETTRTPGTKTTETYDIIIATNTVQTTTGVRPIPTIDTYVYQPLSQIGNIEPRLCTAAAQGCRKFNIFYKLEAPTPDCPAPDNICKVTSKNR